MSTRLTFEEISNHMMRVPRFVNGKAAGVDSMDCNYCPFTVTRDEIDAEFPNPVGPARFNRMLGRIRTHLKQEHQIG